MSAADDDMEFPGLGISKERFRAILAEEERKEAIQKKRRATLKAKREAREAERLSKPPVDLDEAWLRHIRDLPLMSLEAWREWFREHGKFEFDGTMWRRERVTHLSNSGKSQRTARISYHGDDGRVITTYYDGPNRRNDPDRNGGLGRE